MTTLPPPSRNVRATLIQQQARAPNVELTLPTVVRNPFILILWTLTLSTVVAALLLGRIRLPHTAHGLLVAPSTPDSLTPILLLPAWSRSLLQPGGLATVDTGGSQPVTVTIAGIDATPVSTRLGAPNASTMTLDATMVVAHLAPCTRPACPKLTPGTRYPAVAYLGTRSLASLAIPRT